MKIILNDNTELNPIIVTGGPQYIQGENRDTLNFIFSATEDMISLDEAFTVSNCENITIISDDNSEAIHKGYTIRAGLKKESVEVSNGTESEAPVYEDRITISMSQRTYMESQLVATQLAVEMLCMTDVEIV